MTGIRPQTGFVEVAAGVHVLRHPVLDVNVTLVVGDGAALLVDTLSGAAQATELLAGIRRITAAPLVVVNTHHHFDHCFGNATFAAAGIGSIWAHEQAVVELRDRGDHWQRTWYEEWQPSHPALADELATAVIRVPDRTVHDTARLDIGGRPVVLRHFGRGHTAGDLVVQVPDVDALLAGDLIEEGAPPAFDESYPLEWPETVAALIALLSPDTVIVPGHGAPVDLAFAQAQHGQLSKMDWVIREGDADGADAETVAARSPFGADAGLVAVKRGYAQLAGRL